jgi:hypothetical protein
MPQVRSKKLQYMNYIKKLKEKNAYFFLLTLSLFALISSPLAGSSFQDTHEHIASISSVSDSLFSDVLQFAQENLPLEGELLVNSDGFGYIKVPDEYIHTLFPMLGVAEEGFNEPTYFRSSESTGAHISVFYVDENIWPDEVGQIFKFNLKSIEIVNPSKTVSFAVLVIKSSEIEGLRVKYGLSPKLHGHEFHISLAKKVIRGS